MRPMTVPEGEVGSGIMCERLNWTDLVRVRSVMHMGSAWYVVASANCALRLVRWVAWRVRRRGAGSKRTAESGCGTRRETPVRRYVKRGKTVCLPYPSALQTPHR